LSRRDRLACPVRRSACRDRRVSDRNPGACPDTHRASGHTHRLMAPRDPRDAALDTRYRLRAAAPGTHRRLGIHRDAVPEDCYPGIRQAAVPGNLRSSVPGNRRSFAPDNRRDSAPGSRQAFVPGILHSVFDRPDGIPDTCLKVPLPVLCTRRPVRPRGVPFQPVAWNAHLSLRVYVPRDLRASALRLRVLDVLFPG